MARQITFDNMVFLGVNTKEYKNKEGINKISNNAKVYDTLTNENHDYFIRAELAEELKKLSPFQPCKIILNVSVFNGQAGLALHEIKLAEQK